MIKKLRIYDPWLFAFAVAATCIGFLFIFDAGYATTLQKDKGGMPDEFFHQILFAGIGCGVAWVCSRISIDFWKKGSKLIWLVNIALLIAVALVGQRVNGAKRWLGHSPLGIQPAEFAKLAAVLYLAGYFAERKAWPKRIKPCANWMLQVDNVWVPKVKRCLPAVWVFGAAFLIILEPDLGTGAVVAATAFFMFLPAGVTKKSIIAALVLACLGAGVAVIKEPYRMARMMHHTQRWSSENVDDLEYQTVQSELAIAEGGIIGVGPGAGRAKQVLPVTTTTTDFIWATVSEEFGLVGSLIFLAVLGGMVFRLMQLAKRATSRFSMLLFYGVAFWIGLQTCVNVMMANAMLPAIGIPLPFISSGGSSLIALWIAVGVCQSALAPARSKPDRPDDDGGSNPTPPTPKRRVATQSGLRSRKVTAVRVPSQTR